MSARPRATSSSTPWAAEAALVLLVTREAKLGLVFLELKRTTVELARHLS